jgi:diguanylate cyclase (GGDEF)-like protein
MPLVSEKNIARVSFCYAVIVVGLMTLATGALFITKKVATLETDLSQLEEEFIAEQKTQLKVDVDDLLGRIEAQNTRMNQRLQESLATRVEEARRIASSLSVTMGDHLPPEKRVEMIREAIRPIRLNENLGYFFIFTLDGQAVLYPADPDAEGSNFLTNNIGGGPEVIRAMIAIAREQGRGFFRYHWTKPKRDDGKLFEKISYVTLFEPLGWLIGTGEYVDDLDALAQTSVAEELCASLSAEGNDYFFVYDIHNLQGGEDFATMLVNSNRPDLVGQKISDDYPDAHGTEFRKIFMEGIRNTGEAYVVYWYQKPDGSGEGRKLSFFKFYPKWNWIVARGIYFDRLDAVIAQKKADLRQKVKDDILLLSLLFLLAVTIALIVAYHFSKELQNIFDRHKKTREEQYLQLENLHHALEQQSRRDSLTGIYNRGYFNKQLTVEISRTARNNTPLSLILFDIDWFKKINDSLGHPAGDKVLQELVELVGKNIRPTDTLARWGGEEFALLAAAADSESALALAEKLRNLIARHIFSTQSRITCSFGVTSYRPPEEADLFIQRADDALYQAKQGGRNHSCVL